MRILLDGQYFGEGDSLEAFAELSGLPVERFEFHPDDLKTEKVDEFAARAIDDLAPLFTGDHGRDETLHILAAHVHQICQALGVQMDSRLSEVVAIGQKALAKRDEVESVPETDANGNRRPLEDIAKDVRNIRWDG